VSRQTRRVGADTHLNDLVHTTDGTQDRLTNLDVTGSFYAKDAMLSGRLIRSPQVI